MWRVPREFVPLEGAGTPSDKPVGARFADVGLNPAVFEQRVPGSIDGEFFCVRRPYGACFLCRAGCRRLVVGLWRVSSDLVAGRSIRPIAPWSTGYR